MWDEDHKAAGKKLRLEECRMAMETMRACLQSSYDVAEIYRPPIGVKETGMGMKGSFSPDFTMLEPDPFLEHPGPQHEDC